MATGNVVAVVGINEETDKKEITPELVEEYAVFLGLDVEHDRDLLWIARQGLEEKLPEPWVALQIIETTQVFYHNVQTQESTWTHPCDKVYAAMLQRAKEARVTLALTLTAELTARSLRVCATNLAGAQVAAVDLELCGQVLWADVRERLTRQLSLPATAVPRFLLRSGGVLGHSHLSKNLAEIFGWQTLRL